MLSGTSTVQAVENGEDATGNRFAVAIYNEDSKSGCSGVPILPNIVATVAHCVFGNDGRISNNIWIGDPGENAETAYLKKNKVSSVSVTDDYSVVSVGGKVADNDLAFLVLDSQLTGVQKINLASVAEVEKLKARSAPLRVIGYGRTSQADNSGFKLPNVFQGSYSQVLNSNYPNSAFMKSIKGRTCKGDSGSPVLSITASSVTLVGVVSGGALDGNCAKIQADGSYMTLFTEISNYANLAFGASAVSWEKQTAYANAEMNKAKAEITRLNSIISGNSDDSEKFIKDLDFANACVVAAKKIIKTKKGKLPKGC
jgi:secreted trypsin-like serine protease